MYKSNIELRLTNTYNSQKNPFIRHYYKKGDGKETFKIINSEMSN